MVRRAYTPEQITVKLREAEILLIQGATVGEAGKRIGVTEQTYFRWRKECGGMQIEQAKRLKELEKKNAQLKKLVADLSLDNSIGKLRDELVDREIFTTLLEAKVLIENWRKEYNHVRPHSFLGYRPPAPEAIQPALLMTTLT